MKFPLALIFAVIFGHVAAQNKDNPKLAAIPRYHDSVVDTIFGIAVPDQYRWLEAVNSDSTGEWLKRERNLTHSETSKFDGLYFEIINKMVGYQNVQFDYLVKEGPYFFSYKLTSRTGTPVLFYRKDINSEYLVACDPMDFNLTNSPIISNYAISDDAQYLAISLSTAGSDWQTIRIVNLSSQFPLKDKIDWVKFSNIVWWKNGFFYARFEEPQQNQVHLAENRGQKMYYHKLGDKQEDDVLIYVVPAASKSIFRFDITSNKKYLVIYSTMKISGKMNNIVAFKDLDAGLFEEFQPIIMESADSASGGYEIIDFINDKFVVSTTRGAPQGRVLLFDKTQTNAAVELIPQLKEVLTGVHHVGGRLLCTYQGTGTYAAAVFDYEGRLQSTLNFDTGIAVHGFYGSPSDPEVFYYQNTFYCPPVVAKLNIRKNTSEFFGKTKVTFDVKDYTTEIVVYKSKDGTDIPMYLTHRKDLRVTGQNPVLLYGYGGYGISSLPTYDFSNIIFFENGGILAVPLIRGGGEFGEQWHTAGSGLKKQNSFDDFISAAEYLIKKGYTSPERLAIKGASNGGLLVGALLTQRPDLFKVAIAEAGAYDMLRYHLFTGGKYVQDEYGISTNARDFKNLLAYSPLHNLKDGVNYPSALIIASQNDDRVPPLHSYKFLANLQEKSSGNNPHILYFQTDEGHNGPTNIFEFTRKRAFELAFMFHEFKLPLKTNF